MLGIIDCTLAKQRWDSSEAYCLRRSLGFDLLGHSTGLAVARISPGLPQKIKTRKKLRVLEASFSSAGKKPTRKP